MIKKSPDLPQNNYQIYPHWDITAPLLPARSRLFRIERIGFRTTEIESLSSYIVRLADAHCVSPIKLLRNVIFPSMGKRISYNSSDSWFSAIQINGMGSIADTAATALERLTLRCQLQYSTMLMWRNILSPHRLLRPHKAWCAICYEERLRKGEPVYDMLIWAFESVLICPLHYERLCRVCPHCNRSLPYLATNSRSGFCSRCREWLGTSAFATKSKESSKQMIPAAEMAQQIQIIYSIGTLLTYAPDITPIPTHRIFLSNLAECINREARGSINLFADLTGIWSGAIRRLLTGKTKPRLEVLCHLCSRLNISLLDLITGAVKDEVLERQHLILERDTPMPIEITPWGEVEGKLQIASRETPPPSMESVAHRMGHHPPRVKKHFPELCVQIISRYKEHLRSRHPPPKEIRKALRAALKEQPPPSLQRVFRRLGCRDTGYYYYVHYLDLCLAVAERYKEHRNIPFDKDVDRKRLRVALTEEPPPSFSEVARRLGHKREFVHRKFPELSKAVTSRYMYYRTALRKERDERLLQEIREAMSHITALGLYASEARVREHVKLHLQHPGRASLFKQALREVKSEIGIVS